MCKISQSLTGVFVFLNWEGAPQARQWFAAAIIASFGMNCIIWILGSSAFCNYTQHQQWLGILGLILHVYTRRSRSLLQLISKTHKAKQRSGKTRTESSVTGLVSPWRVGENDQGGRQVAIQIWWWYSTCCWSVVEDDHGKNSAGWKS